MKLTLYTDYALRVLLYVSINQTKLITINEIASTYDISKNHLMKVTHHLGQLEYIETVRGRNGGIRLAKEPGEINIGKLVRQTEEDFYLVECFEDNGACILSPTCTLKLALSKATKAFLGVLDEYTLADFIKNKEMFAILSKERQ